MELGLIRKVDIDQEMQQSYLDYAMSVIVARALPDARDGLKPVQRRILFAMYDMGLRQDVGYRKSARVVGEVLGKYHPHGELAVYDSLARMAQDFTMRYALVDGQGNFGSVDGDPPAAMRYTEARLTAFSMDMLAQIQQNTVNFSNNFDGTLIEPDVLPAALPNLLVNGATGIAVGMATNIPPHNLGEVVDALVYMLQQWEKLDDLSVDRLMQFIKGPDFPTGGVIIQDPQGDGLTSAYGSGRGRVIVQARAHMEEMVRGRNRIIVTELPYQTNKSSLIERIADLVRGGDLEGIADLRDESDRQGMRIVIELSKTADPESILKELYKRTPMQSTFGINLLALVEGEPRLLSLKQALRVFIEHRLVVIKRRSEYELERAKQRAHILEGLRIALKYLDEVIALIRNSPDVEQARERLMKRYKLSEVQAQAILDMQLRRLAALERKKIELEYKEIIALIKELQELLQSPKRIRQVAAAELASLKDKYGDRRRTQIVNLKEGVSVSSLLTTTDTTPEQQVWVCVTEDGRIGRVANEFQPRLSGRDAPLWVVDTNTHQTLYLVTDQGKAAAIPVHAVPELESTTNGSASVYKVAPLPEKEPLAVVFSLPGKRESDQEVFLVTVTRGGMMKKTAIAELPGPSAQSFILVKVNDGDLLGWAFLTGGKNELMLLTARGMGIRFSEDEVRPMGLVAAGVAGIKLGVGDEVVGVEKVERTGDLLLVASDGKSKRIAVNDFPLQGRYGQGVIAWKLSGHTRIVGTSLGKGTSRVTLFYEKAASRLFRLDEAPLRSRAVQGQGVIEVKPGDSLIGLTSVWDGLSFWDKSIKAERKAAEPRKKVTVKNLEIQGILPLDSDAVRKSQRVNGKATRGRKPRTGASQKGDGSGVGKSAKATPKKRAPRSKTASEEQDKPVAKTRGRSSPQTKAKSTPVRGKNTPTKAKARTRKPG